MTCTNPYKLTVDQLYKNTPTIFLNRDKYPLGYIEFPCGHCISCKIHRSREWALRITHEMSYWEDTAFITLTYNDKHLPKSNSIIKSDLQNFFKRLRKIHSPIKYYACGEYGEKGGRPHYHMILFGIKFTLDQVSEKGQVLSGPVFDAWTKRLSPIGIIHHGTVTPDSARYVTGYIDKKYNGSLEYEIYKKNNLQTPFQIVSQGLGLRHALNEKNNYIKNLHTTIKGQKIGLPTYYKRKLKIPSNAFEALSIKKLYDLYSLFDSKGYSLEESNHLIRLARKQKELTLKSKQNIKDSRFRKL